MGEKPFKCSYYDKTFTDSPNCTRHARTHDKRLTEIKRHTKKRSRLAIGEELAESTNSRRRKFHPPQLDVIRPPPGTAATIIKLNVQSCLWFFIKRSPVFRKWTVCFTVMCFLTKQKKLEVAEAMKKKTT